ncbi:helix-turn-helix domain-containing protein [Acinetobacter bereziniae]|uniref:helix-turn-helix domain-containing protein n=1 Tax=Acinetobacter bereziniae TaxID=106648 RepID=UPI00148F3360|nr:helix-turn-helix transcriptional regulator [Acinetobacter bereziniae]
MKERGERIRELRKARHVSIVELAQYMGISKNSYSRIEEGIRDMKCGEAQDLSIFLNVHLTLILGIKPPHLVSDKIRKFAVNSGFRNSEINPRLFNFAKVVIQDFHIQVES